MQTAGPALERKADIAAFLTSLEPGSVFFIDEIHRLNRGDRGDALPGDGGPPAARRPRPGRRRPHRHPRPAAVHARRRDHARRPADDAAARPLRRLAPTRALRPRATWRGSSAARRRSSASRSSADGERAIAERSRGTPRVANRLLQAGARLRRGPRRRRRSRATVAAEALGLLEVDEAGLDRHDRTILETIARKFARRPGRPLDPRRRRRRGAGHDRGRLRALPPPAGADQAHAARPGAHRARLRAPRAPVPDGARASVLRLRVSGRPLARLPACRSSSARTAGTGSCSASGPPGSPRRPKGCSKCGVRLPLRAARRLLPGPRRGLLHLRPGGPRARRRPQRVRAHRAARTRT